MSLQYFIEDLWVQTNGKSFGIRKKKEEGDFSRKKTRHVKEWINLYSSPAIVRMKQGI